LIPIDTTKELDFHADFKYISYTKANSSKVMSLRKSLHFQKKVKQPLKVIESSWKSYHQIQPIYKLYCRGFKLLSVRYGILYSLPEERSRMRVYFIFCFFFQRWSYRSSDPRISREGSFEWKLEVLVPFLSNQQIRGQLALFSAHVFPKFTQSKFWDRHFVQNIQNIW